MKDIKKQVRDAYEKGYANLIEENVILEVTGKIFSTLFIISMFINLILTIILIFK